MEKKEQNPPSATVENQSNTETQAKQQQQQPAQTASSISSGLKKKYKHAAKKSKSHKSGTGIPEKGSGTVEKVGDGKAAEPIVKEKQVPSASLSRPPSLERPPRKASNSSLSGGEITKASDFVLIPSPSAPVFVPKSQQSLITPSQATFNSLPNTILNAPHKPSPPVLPALQPTASLFQPRHPQQQQPFAFPPGVAHARQQSLPYQPPHLRVPMQNQIESKRRMLDGFEKEGLPENEDRFYQVQSQGGPQGGNRDRSGSGSGSGSFGVEEGKLVGSLLQQHHAQLQQNPYTSTPPFSGLHPPQIHSQQTYPPSQHQQLPPNVSQAPGLGLVLYPTLPNRLPRKMSRGAQIVDESWGIVEVDDHEWSTQGGRTRSGTGTSTIIGTVTESVSGSGGKNTSGGSLGRRSRRLSYVGQEDDLAGLPSPVKEESGASSTNANEQAKEVGEGGTMESNCTSCGKGPDQSFVALVPCDHLLCHHCVNALINSAAHKPPRDMTCFSCAALVKSFVPAWETTNSLGLVEALKESIKSQKAQENVDRRAANVSGGSHRKSASTNTYVVNANQPFTTLSPLGLKNIWGNNNKSPSHSKESSSESAQGVSGRDRRLRNLSETSGFSPLRLAMGPNRTRSASGQFQFRSLLAKDGSIKGDGNQLLQHNSTAGLKYNPQLPTPDSSFYSTPPRSSDRHERSSRNIKRSSLPLSPDTTFSTPELLKMSERGLSPQRSIDWSKEMENEMEMPQTPPGERASNPGSQEKGKGVFRSPVDVDQLQDLVDPIDWPVVRLDNIPWDISVAEVTEWLPPDTLAPSEQCVLPIHILCNRVDGRTLNQCYIEVASVEAARAIVRGRDGRKMRKRPVHVTLSSQSELMTTIYPAWDAGFSGSDPNPAHIHGPLLLQTELTGLVVLCKLETNHAFKAPERPYYNIVTILQKFPWHQPDCYNSKQIVRLYNTACAAVETLHVVRAHADLPEWMNILCVMADAVLACPVFRPVQKEKFVKKTGLCDTRPVPLAQIYQQSSQGQGGFTFSPPSLREHYVTVGLPGPVEEGSPTPSAILELAPHPHESPTGSYSNLFKKKSRIALVPPQAITRAASTPNLFSSQIAAKAAAPVFASTQGYIQDFPTFDGSAAASPKKQKKRTRRYSSISRQLGVDTALVAQIAQHLQEESAQ